MLSVGAAYVNFQRSPRISLHFLICTSDAGVKKMKLGKKKRDITSNRRDTWGGGHLLSGGYEYRSPALRSLFFYRGRVIPYTDLGIKGITTQEVGSQGP